MRRIIGLMIALIAVALLLVACVWSGFLVYVFMEGRGNDEEAVMIMQPLTCICMMPVGLALLIGTLLALIPSAPTVEQE